MTYRNVDERYGNPELATLKDYSEANPRGIFIEFDDGIYEKPHNGSVWVKVAEVVDVEPMLSLSAENSYSFKAEGRSFEIQKTSFLSISLWKVHENRHCGQRDFVLSARSLCYAIGTLKVECGV